MSGLLYNDVPSLSRTSLVLNKIDDLHSNAGSTLTLDRPLHPYYTRSIAKISRSNNASPASSSDSNFSRDSKQFYTARHLRKLEASASFVTALSQVNTDEDLIVPNTTPNECGSKINGVARDLNGNINSNQFQIVPLSSRSNLDNAIIMEFPGDCPNRAKKMFTLVFVGILGIIAMVALQRMSDSKSFLSKIEDDLCRIKDEIQRMKYTVDKGTKTQLASMEKDTREKLDTVERLLKEIRKEKKSYKNPFTSCAEKAFASGDIRSTVMRLLDEYNADKTGKTDFALESAGGSIASCGSDTVPYNPASSITTLFGIPLCYKSNGPRSIIQPTVLPGECWAFKGSLGTVTIKLLGSVWISGVSLEHISKSISPSGEIDSAPKHFSIWGISDIKSESLGEFTYDINGPTLQYFEIANSLKPYQHIEFKVHSNHGNPEYTCVYRLRVHGSLESAQANNSK